MVLEAGSVEVTPGLRSRVGVVFGKEREDESTRLTADCNESVGPEALEYFIGVLDFIAWRRASRASVEDMVFSKRRELQRRGACAMCHVETAQSRCMSRDYIRENINLKFSPRFHASAPPSSSSVVILSVFCLLCDGFLSLSIRDGMVSLCWWAFGVHVDGLLVLGE